MDRSAFTAVHSFNTTTSVWKVSYMQLSVSFHALTALLLQSGSQQQAGSHDPGVRSQLQLPNFVFDATTLLLDAFTTEFVA